MSDIDVSTPPGAANSSGTVQARSVILASTSRYRRELLGRLRLPFAVEPPDVDETPAPSEQPVTLARRLAHQKALAVAARFTQAVVIGSDQVADLDGTAVGKPGSHGRAMAQLMDMRGRRVIFHTALSVVCIESGFEQHDVAPVAVHFRHFSAEEADRYLRADEPYDCAGSAKSESLGVALLESIDSDDPTALVGLPLIRTCRMLRAAGIRIP